MGGDDGVDLGHEADGFGKGDHDFMIVLNVVRGEGAAFAVLEPLIANLITADVEVPDLVRHTLETAGLGFVDPYGLIGIRYFHDLLILAADPLCDVLVQFRRLQQVQVNEFFAELG